MPDSTKKTISATEASALFGVSPYCTRWMLYKRFADGVETDNAGDNRMDWGTKMQPLLLEQAAADLRLEVKADQNYVRRGLLGCTRDAQIICPDRGPGALETKCVFDYGVWMKNWDGGKSPPKQHEIQLQVQMYVGDGTAPYQWGIISAWVCGEQKYFERKPLPDLWAELEKEAARFFDDVANKREPNAFGEAIELPLLAKLYPVQSGKRIDLTTHARASELAEQAQLMNYHSAERSAHDKAEKAIKAMFKAMMADAEEATLLHGVKLRQQQISRVGYTVKPSSYSTIQAFVPENAPQAEVQQNILSGG